MDARSKGKSVLGTVGLLILIAFFPQIPGCIGALGPKYGRVIDQDTGEGVPGVAVVEEGRFAQNGLWQGSQTCTYGKIAYTDSGGNYVLSSALSRVSVGIPFASPHEWSTLRASKSGYVSAETATPLKIDYMGGLQELPPWDSRISSSSWNGFWLSVPALKLRRVDLSLKERVAYFLTSGLTVHLGCPVDQADLVTLSTAVRNFYQSEIDYVCGATTEETIDTRTLSSLAIFASDYPKFEKRMNQLAHPALGANPFQKPYAYRMSDVCEAMKAGGNK
jgi:hypothetical protein